jgi:hypothetical protein
MYKSLKKKKKKTKIEEAEAGKELNHRKRYEEEE